jgi:hypothetical protein
MTSQNLVKQIDLTGLEEVTASEINQLLETALLADDKSINLYTTDTALNTPEVPDPTQGELEGVDVEFWTRFQWIRIPHSSAGAESKVKHYFWNPNATSITTYLKWQSPDDDLDNLADDVDALEDDLNALDETVTTLTTSVTTAITAGEDATAAVATLTTTVNNLDQRVSNAETDITNLNTAVTNLSNNLSTPIAIAKGGTGAATVNAACTNLGLDKAAVAFAIIKDIKAQNTNGGVFAAGAWATRTLNTLTTTGDTDISISDNQITLLRGTYLIEAEAPAFGVLYHQAKLYNVSTGTDTAFGSTEFSQQSDDPVQTKSKIMHIVSIDSTQIFEIRHKNNGANGETTGLGQAANLGSEIYTQVKITRLQS